MNNFTNNYPLNGMYANNNIGGYMPSGYTQQQQVQPKMQNVLTPDEIKSLRKTVDKFSLGLTQEEVLRGRCTHKDENGVEIFDDWVFDGITILGYRPNTKVPVQEGIPNAHLTINDLMAEKTFSNQLKTLCFAYEE